MTREAALGIPSVDILTYASFESCLSSRPSLPALHYLCSRYHYETRGDNQTSFPVNHDLDAWAGNPEIAKLLHYDGTTWFTIEYYDVN